MARRGLAVWLGALVVAAAAVVLIHRLAPQADNPFTGYRLAIVGSSLMRHGIPAKGDILGNGATVRRYGRYNIRERETLDAFELAVAAGARDIMVEAPALLFDFAHQREPRECDNWLIAGWTRLAETKRDTEHAVRRLAGQPVFTDWVNEETHLQAGYGYRQRFAAIYPMQLRPLSCRSRFAALVARAKRQGSRVVLILPPRSSTASAYIGRDLETRIRASAQALARRHGLLLFAPHGPWPDALFVDQAHFNREGRARFVAELRRWYRSQ